MDFTADQLVGGQRFRLLTSVDNHSRESLAIEVGQRLAGDDVVRVLEQVTAERRGPKSIQVDNGPEFISRSLDLWAYFNGVKLDEALAVTEAWKEDYNRVRPHGCGSGFRGSNSTSSMPVSAA